AIQGLAEPECLRRQDLSGLVAEGLPLGEELGLPAAACAKLVLQAKGGAADRAGGHAQGCPERAVLAKQVPAESDRRASVRSCTAPAMAHVPYRLELPPGTTSTRWMESGTRPQLIHPPKPSLSGTPSRSTSPRRLPSPCKPKSCAVGWLYRLLRRLGCMPGTARSRSSVWGPLRNGVASICSRVRIVGEPGPWRAGMCGRVAVN